MIAERHRLWVAELTLPEPALDYLHRGDGRSATTTFSMTGRSRCTRRCTHVGPDRQRCRRQDDRSALAVAVTALRQDRYDS